MENLSFMKEMRKNSGSDSELGSDKLRERLESEMSIEENNVN